MLEIIARHLRGILPLIEDQGIQLDVELSPAHNGSKTCEAEESKGTTLTALLPLAAQRKPICLDIVMTMCYDSTEGEKVL